MFFNNLKNNLVYDTSIGPVVLSFYQPLSVFEDSDMRLDVCTCVHVRVCVGWGSSFLLSFISHGAEDAHSEVRWSDGTFTVTPFHNTLKSCPCLRNHLNHHSRLMPKKREVGFMTIKCGG